MIKAYTDLGQSKRLAEFLPLDSADMEYILEQWIDEKTGRHKEGYDEIPVVKVEDDCPLQPITHPCWSLAALFDVLPEGVVDNCYVPNLQKENGKYSIAYGDDELLCIADNPIDTCYEMIMKLHEQKLI